MNRSKFIFPSSKISIIFFLLNFFGNFIFLLKKMTEDDVIRGINFFDMFDLRKQSHVRIYIYFIQNFIIPSIFRERYWQRVNNNKLRNNRIHRSL